MAGAVRSGVESEGGVLVSFQGTTGGDALSGTSVFGRGHLELVDQLAACAVRDHNVDPTAHLHDWLQRGWLVQQRV